MAAIKVYQNIQEGLSNNFIDGFVGVNKTGKSSTQKKVAEIWRATHDDSMQIYGFDYQNVFGSLISPKNRIRREDKNWALKCCKLRNCLLILDEIRLLCPSPQHPPQGLAELFSQCFFWNISIMWSCHNPGQVPETCTYHTTIYHIFLNMARKQQFKNKIPDYELAYTASKLVKRYVKIHGRGKHKLDPSYTGQGFVYMIVDMESQTVTAVNMNKKI